MGWYGGWRPYVPVARRQAQAASYAAKLAKKEKRALCPVKPKGRNIASSFWGKAWCENLEAYSDFENRLPRGRSYIRNGSVIDIQIKTGQIKALVSGSSIYRVTIDISTLPPALWKRIQRDCSQSIDSLIDLLQGRFDQGVMTRLSQQEGGLFPRPKEIKIACSCPDWAVLCKHAAAVLYGVGARLDTDPELLFTLRNVDHLELVGSAVSTENLDRTLAASGKDALTGDLGEIFGIDIDGGTPAPKRPTGRKRQPAAPEPVQAVARPARKSFAGEPKINTPAKRAPRKTPVTIAVAGTATVKRAAKQAKKRSE